jgi:hypothetical protein
MILWPERLVSDLARRRAVVVLGSGISRNSKNEAGQFPRTWGEFLSSQKPRMSGSTEFRAALRRYDYLTACELLKMELGGDDFRSLLISEFLAPRYQASEFHRAIFKLDSRIVATPNFDKIYETFANAEAQGSIRVKNHYDLDVADAIRREERLILKFHGSIDTPDKMIFTRREYAHARTEHGNFYKILEALALTHTFLFLGCGVHDPDTRLLLEDIFFRYSVNRPHVFVLPQRAVKMSEKEIIETSMNLSITEYTNKSKDHSSLLVALNDLATRVESARNLLVATRNW